MSRKRKRLPLHESTYLTEAAKVDTDRGVIQGVWVIGRKSKNGREYSDQALRDVRDRVQECVVYLNHDKTASRQIQHKFGVLRDGRVEERGVVADLHYLKTHEMSEPIVEAAQRFPKTFGLSINGEGDVKHKGGMMVVENVVDLASVDLVASPATTSGLWESQGQGNGGRSMKFKDVASRNAKSRAGRLLAKLLEMDGMEAYGEDEVVVPETMAADSEPSAKDELKAAIMKMVEEIFNDDSLDADATIEKIGSLLGEFRSAVPGEPEATDTGEGDGGGESSESDGEDKVAESVAGLTRGVARELLEASGIKPRDGMVSALVACRTKAERAELIESWKPKVEGKNKPLIESRRSQGAGAGKSWIDEVRAKQAAR